MNYKFTKVKDMAVQRNYAIDKCYELNDKFKEHFDKIYNNQNDKNNLIHWATEMNSWWLYLSSIILKQNNKPIKFKDMEDWFFIGVNHSKSKECFTNDDLKKEEDIYIKFYNILYKETKDVIEALKKVNLF